MNSRTKRRFRVLGMTPTEALEAAKKLKNFESNPTKVHCSYMDYHISSTRLANIYAQARSLNLGGKHIGSKPLHKLLKQMSSMQKTLTRYMTALKAMERIEKSQTENVN